jgi:hypothetical protein
MEYVTDDPAGTNVLGIFRDGGVQAQGLPGRQAAQHRPHPRAAQPPRQAPEPRQVRGHRQRHHSPRPRLHLPQQLVERIDPTARRDEARVP